MSDAVLTVAEEAPKRVEAKAATTYDAFISYSHANGKPLASALQSAMQRLGKPWYRRRALRLFRDDTSLTATPHLWPSIEKALRQSRFLILMASPEAAASRWVNQELAWWLEHKSAETVLIALTGGELDWDGETGDFRAGEAIPLPPALAGKFADEPLWIDLRPYRETASPRDAHFTDLAASIAATLHGRAKEDLLSQEVRQQRRALRLAGSAVALLLVLLGLAGWQWRVAEHQKLEAELQRNEAEAQRNRAEHTLELATKTANGLIFELAQKFRDAGVPASVTADILARARQLQIQLNLTGETSPDLRRTQAAALLETADSLFASGDTSAALTDARQAHDLIQALLAAAPDNTDYQRDLLASDLSMGAGLRAEGDLTGALACYRDGLAIATALAVMATGNTEWQYDLGISYEKIGEVLREQGDLPGALAAFRDEHTTVKALAERDPGNTPWQRRLSINDEKIGEVLQTQGDLPGALTAYRDGLAIIKAVAAKDLGNTLWQSDLSASYRHIGDALQTQGDLPGALAACRDSLAIAKALAAKDPGNTLWQGNLLASETEIGGVLQAQGDLAGALATFRDGLTISQALTAKDPFNLQWRRSLLVSFTRVGAVAFQQNDLIGALDAFEQAKKLALQLKTANPTAATSVSDLELVQARIAEIRQKLAAGNKN